MRRRCFAAPLPASRAPALVALCCHGCWASQVGLGGGPAPPRAELRGVAAAALAHSPTAVPLRTQQQRARPCGSGMVTKTVRRHPLRTAVPGPSAAPMVSSSTAVLHLRTQKHTAVHVEQETRPGSAELPQVPWVRKRAMSVAVNQKGSSAMVASVRRRPRRPSLADALVAATTATPASPQPSNQVAGESPQASATSPHSASDGAGPARAGNNTGHAPPAGAEPVQNQTATAAPQSSAPGFWVIGGSFIALFVVLACWGLRASGAMA